MYFIPVIKAELASTLVSHDASEISLIWWSEPQETFLNVINVENSCAAEYFPEHSV